MLKHLREQELRGQRPAMGVMGGTFDPVHVGHVELARAALARLQLDGILYIPTGRPSFKRDRDVTPTTCRVDMLRLALADEPCCAISLREVERPGITYAVDTFEELRREVPPGTRLVYLMGADSVDTLPAWHRAERLLELCEVAAFPRKGVDLGGALQRVRREFPWSTVYALETSVPDVSSTELRSNLGAGESCEGLIDLSVLAYIRKHGLYGFRLGCIDQEVCDGQEEG